MYALKVDEPIKDVAGNVIQSDPNDPTPFTLGRAIAMYLQQYRGNDIDAIKAMSLAKRFYKGESVAVDKSDILALKTIFKADTTLTAVVKGPVLELLEEAEEEKEAV